MTTLDERAVRTSPRGAESFAPPLLELSDAAIHAPGGRLLFDGLTLRLSRDRVALVGRNGVGKSTLLAVLAGCADVERGRVAIRGTPYWVPQVLPRTGAHSQGELRRCALCEAWSSGAEILLLDEPTEDLDETSVSWLRAKIRDWRGCLIVVSHDRRLLGDFQHFFIASESGCRYFTGSLDELDTELERQHEEAERRYLQNLHHLAMTEEHMLHVACRKARKKRYGRCSELDRATPRIRLNQKRSEAQASHGRLSLLRAERLDAVRQWTRATRRALAVRLSLELPAPALPVDVSERVVVLREVSARTTDRLLFDRVSLQMGRQRVGVVGPNGAGKSTLLDVLLGRRLPFTGSATSDLSKLGAIAQGAADWMLDDSLVSYLMGQGGCATLEDAAKLIVQHRFPLALAERSMRSLSPGERTRAALIALFRRAPPLELLVLDEPTFSLDLVGQRALMNTLRAFGGGLVVASHDRAFLRAVGIDEYIELGSREGG